MLNRLRHNQKGFTLIELMIVIAIIGILAAIAIPNFIAYRDKSFCSSAESDANNIAAGLADYYAIPTIVSDVQGGGARLNLARAGNATAGIELSGQNTYTLSDTTQPAITITVTDASTRCPADYQANMTAARDPEAYWDGANVYTKVITN